MNGLGKVNLSLIIGNNDELIHNVEELVNARKVAVEIDRGHRKYSAPNEFVLRIRPTSSHLRGLLVLARKSGGRNLISLVTENGEMLRQYHYHYGGHRNPDETIVGSSHKHFPTHGYPLAESHKDVETWAYEPEPFPNDFIEAVKEFCKECNITINGLQERLPWRWFR